MKKYILISLLLMASVVYAVSPEKPAYYGDQFLICLQPDVMLTTIDVRGGVPVTGISSLDKLISLREIVVMEQYLPGATPDDMDGDIILSNIYRLSVGPGRSELEQVIANFTADPSVLYAGKEVIYYPLYTPNDTRFGSQWHLQKIKAPEVWDLFDIPGGVFPGDRAIVLASVDSGVQYTHPDLRDQIWINQAEIPVAIFNDVDANSNGIVTAEEVSAYVTDYNSNGTTDLQDALHMTSPFMDGVDGDDWDNNPSSYVDDLFGWDAAGATSGNDPDNDPMGTFTGPSSIEAKMHGTHVGGILCAATDNGTGVASVIYNGTLMSVKMMADNSDDGFTNAMAAVLYAAKAGADILNLSWGGSGYNPLDQATFNLVYDTYGAVTVGAAGNGNDNGTPSNVPFYPSGYDKVISVTALGSSDDFSWANYGDGVGNSQFSGVAISAPGENILSTVYTTSGSYQSWPGTSMASPIVASSFGLLKATFPEASNDWLVDNILGTTDPIDHLNPNYAGQLGTGRVNIYNAIAHNIIPQLSYDSHSMVITNDNGDGQLTPGEEARLRVNIFNEPDWVDALSVTGILRSNSEHVTILDSTGAYGDIFSGNVGVNVTDRYQFAIAPDAPAANYPFTLELTANSEGDPYSVIVDFSIEASIWQAYFPVPTASIIGGTAVIDLDRDGSSEIIFGAADSMIHALTINGSELAGFPVQVGREIEASPAVGDVDNDGDLEIVIGSKDSKIYLVQDDGSAAVIYTATHYLLAPPTLFDLDGDGDLEIIMPGYGRELIAIHHDGLLLDGFPITQTDRLTKGVAVGDINDDGNVNIIVGDWGGMLYAYQLDGTQAPGFPVTVSANDKLKSAPVLIDLDQSGDGQLEIVIGSDDNLLHAYSSDGTHLWSFQSQGAQNIQTDPAICDMDGDEDLEIAFGCLDRGIYVLDHEGLLLSGFPVMTSGAIYSSPAIGDVDNDGEAEIFIGANDNFLYGINLDGSSVSGFPILNTSRVEGSPTLADIDGDGDAEIIVGTNETMAVFDFPVSGNLAGYWPTHRGNLHRTGMQLTTVGVEEQRALPASHKLYANYPNPFNPTTSISFDLGEATQVTLQILDIRGRLVAELVSAPLQRGSYAVVWDGERQGKPANAGVYFYRLATQNSILVRKMTLLK